MNERTDLDRMLDALEFAESRGWITVNPSGFHSPQDHRVRVAEALLTGVGLSPSE